MSTIYPAAVVKDTKDKLAAKHRITDLGTARQFLGIEIQAGGGGETSLCQRAFIISVLKRFRIGNANGASAPMDLHIEFGRAESGGEREVDPRDYQAIVGSLMDIALATRSDISYATSGDATHANSPVTPPLPNGGSGLGLGFQGGGIV